MSIFGKKFKWRYLDKEHNFDFGGIYQVPFNGFNIVKFTSSKAFYNAFHKAYKGHSILELESICLGKLTYENFE